MKAILVIDINDELLEDYENFYVDYDLRAERKDININESIRYVEDCPLKALPQKKEIQYPTTDGITTVISSEYTLNDYLFDKGYNKCIDEILGGNDE